MAVATDHAPITVRDIPYAMLGLGVLAARKMSEKRKAVSNQLWERWSKAVGPAAHRLNIAMSNGAPDIKTQAVAAFERWQKAFKRSPRGSVPRCL